MTITKVWEQKNKEQQSRACFVTHHHKFANVMDYLGETSFEIIIKNNLIDLMKEPYCGFYIIDTAVKDLDVWPALLSVIPDAESRDWIFLVSNLAEASHLHPLPPNSRLLEERNLTASDIASYIEKQFDPESKKKIENVNFIEDIRAFIVQMGNGRTYPLSLNDISEADSTKVAKWGVSKDHYSIKVRQESGNRFEIPWDDVLYHCEPQYEYYKGNNNKLENQNAGADRIGLRIRRIRQEKGYSIQLLADRIGMKRPNLSRLENGHHQPTLETLEKIAEALEAPLTDLIAGSA